MPNADDDYEIKYIDLGSANAYCLRALIVIICKMKIWQKEIKT